MGPGVHPPPPPPSIRYRQFVVHIYIYIYYGEVLNGPGFSRWPVLRSFVLVVVVFFLFTCRRVIFRSFFRLVGRLPGGSLSLFGSFFLLRFVVNYPFLNAPRRPSVFLPAVPHIRDDVLLLLHLSFFFLTARAQTRHNSCPSASLDYVIEPWFLGAGSSGPGGPEFTQWAEESKIKYGTSFASSVSELPDPKQPRCALISGRTADNPRLFTECIGAKCSTIFLEKPGAPTVLELQKMRDEANAAGVGVLMGYNKVRGVSLDPIVVVVFVVVFLGNPRRERCDFLPE